MKIVKLQSENIKRLHAIEITPEGALITIGGKNGAGKSSVLDSIAWAMGGEKLVPPEPIRAGEAEAKIVVDLGDLVVTRKFKREKIVADPQGEGQPHEVTWGDTTSTLTVTNKDGARYPSPQAVLDRMLGRLTFDPLAFARDDAKKQAEVLRKLVNLDFSLLDAERAGAAARRAMLKKSHETKAAQLLALPFVKDAPAEEIPMEAISNEMRQAEELRQMAEDAERQVAKHETAIVNSWHMHQKHENEIALVDKQIAALNEKREQAVQHRVEVEMGIKDAERAQNAAKEAAQAARAAVPDGELIRVKIKNTEIMNNAVRANQKYREAQAEVEGLVWNINLEHEAVIKAEQAKQAALEAAQFPVPGLGLTDDGVTLNDLPFAQAGSAEQVRVSVAIGIALNPQLKVLLIRNGNLLDKESLAAVAAQAEAASMQVWMEYVSESKDGVAVMLVDGEVV